MNNIYKVGSLFAGVGGVCLGFQTARISGSDSKFELVWANEMDEFACETYRTNFKHKLIQGDINKVLDPELSDEYKENIRKCNNDIELIDTYIKGEGKINETDIKNERILEIINQSKSKESSYEDDKELEYKQKRDLEKLKDELILKNEKLKEEQKEHAKEIQELKLYYEDRHKEIIKDKIDVLLGGFPCQAFSIAGPAKGFEDDRGNLFLSIISLINQLQATHGTDGIGGINGKPRILFLENVKNLKGHDGGRTYQVIKKELEKTGYIIKEHVLNTMDYSDLPQNRERIYIVGFLHKEDAEKFDLFDKINKYKKVKTAQDREEDIKRIIDYSLSKETHNKYYYTKEKYPKYFITEEEYNELPVNEKRDERINLDEQINEIYQFYQVRRGMYVRKNMSNVCPTLTANMGTGGHNVPLIKVKDGVRKLTPAETFRLQGFPVGNGYELPTKYKGKIYTDSHLYKQAGNAVSVPVIKFLAQEILKILG